MAWDLADKDISNLQLSKKLKISLSTLYRFMDRGEIRKLRKRGSAEWSRRVLKSRSIGLVNGK